MTIADLYTRCDWKTYHNENCNLFSFTKFDG